MLLDRKPTLRNTQRRTEKEEEMMTFIIEHLEKKVYPWCVIEYKHISSIVGKKNLWITNNSDTKLKKCARLFRKSVKTMKLEKTCVLDPDADKELKPNDAKKFQYFVFGGILGDYPPRKRTKKELKIKSERRNLGKQQMATDNAVYVAKEILNGRKLSKLQFQDGVEIKTGKKESVQLPYKYVLVKGKPLICKELINRLKKQKGF
ncbi:hypothetical protein HY485_00290 [Candidatus Woesearchaeota archaeon]|nr:hypothetical protein [Candidatus Woesearchaeota archaeon]